MPSKSSPLVALQSVGTCDELLVKHDPGSVQNDYSSINSDTVTSTGCAGIVVDDIGRHCHTPGKSSLTNSDEFHYHRLALVTLGLLSCFLYAGIIFGWSPLLHMYRELGYYRDRCDYENDWCSDRQDKLAEIYTWGSVMLEACAIFVGLFMDLVKSHE